MSRVSNGKIDAHSCRCAASKHLQTLRYLHTIKSFLIDIQRILIQLHKAANEQSAPFVDHAGILRDSKTGRPINGLSDDEDEDDDRMRELSVFISIDIWILRAQLVIPSLIAETLNYLGGRNELSIRTLVSSSCCCSIIFVSNKTHVFRESSPNGGMIAYTVVRCCSSRLVAVQYNL